MKNNKPKWKVNSFYKYASEYRDKYTDNQLAFVDMTQVYQAEQHYMIQNGEVWICQINGKMRGGKSTLAFAEGDRIYKIQKKQGWHKKNEHFGLQNIARDQDEKAELMRDPNTH